jgi:predicted membrane GTPase involved in stress response
VITRFDPGATAAAAYELRHPEYPIEQLARSRSTRFQRGFARMSMHLAPELQDVLFDAGDDGLRILAASELALALPVEVIRQMHAGEVEFGEPQVRLLHGTSVQEPVMGLRAAVPRPQTEAALHELITRGACIEEVDWFACKPTIRACAPLRMLLGYPKTLLALTRGQADLSMWLMHYAPVPPDPRKAS